MKNKAPLDKFAQAVSAGQYDDVLYLGKATSSKKTRKKLEKRINSSENWYIEDKVIHSSSGASVPGYAKWCGIVAVDLKNTVYRYRILSLYYKDTLYRFAIPVEMLKGEVPLKSLPGISLSPAEIRLLIDMADELRNAKSDHETIITLKHPVKKTLYSNIKRFRTYDETLPDRLLKLLNANRVLVWMMIAAFDMQLRAIKKLARAPTSIYNFTPSSKDLQASERILSIFAALNFTAEPGTSEPILIQMKDDKDLCSWYTHVDRMSILCASGTGPLRPLIDEITVRDQIPKSGGLMPAPLPAIPIIISKKFIHCPAAYDAFIPPDESNLFAEDKDLLRNAMAHALSKSNPDEMIRQLDKQMDSAEGYRLKPRTVWQRILMENLFKSISIQEVFLENAHGLIVDEEKALEEARSERRASIQRAMELLQNPDRYKRQLFDRPADKGEAQKAFSDGMLAFRYIPDKGPDAGSKFLAFSKESLVRLLNQAAANEEILDAFLDACEKECILDSRKRSVKLGDNTFSAITFRIDF